MTDGATESFRYTEQDLVDAARLFSGRSLRRPKVIVAYVVLWLVGLIFFMNLVSGPGMFDLAAILDNIGLAIAISILPFALVFAWANWLIPAVARRNFRQQRSLRGEFVYAWTEDKLSVKIEYGSFDMPWDHFVGWAENHKILLLLESDRLYRVIPKRVLNPDQQAELQRLCAKAGI